MTPFHCDILFYFAYMYKNKHGSFKDFIKWTTEYDKISLTYCTINRSFTAAITFITLKIV